MEDINLQLFHTILTSNLIVSPNISTTPIPSLISAMSSIAAAGFASHSNSQMPISEGFIHDDFVIKCSVAQKRPFLRTGISPKVGHRVELTIVLDSTERGDIPFRLSGEVTVVHPTPKWKTEDDSVVAPNANWRPSCSLDDYGTGGGSSVLAFMLRKKLPKERARRDGSVPNLNGLFERVVTAASKEEMKKMVVNKFGALHGQQVVCEGRWVSKVRFTTLLIESKLSTH